MKIGSPADKPTPPAAAPASSAPGASPRDVAGATPPAEASAQVALSNTAKLLSGNDAASGDFDTQKVERMSQAIEKGEFQVNAEAIADKLIANAAELLSGGTAKP